MSITCYWLTAHVASSYCYYDQRGQEILFLTIHVLISLKGFLVEVSQIISHVSITSHTVWLPRDIFSNLCIKLSNLYLVDHCGKFSFAKIRCIHTHDVDINQAVHKCVLDKKTCLVSTNLALNLSLEKGDFLAIHYNTYIEDISLPIANRVYMTFINDKETPIHEFNQFKMSISDILPCLLDGRYGCPGNHWEVDWLNNSLHIYIDSVDTSYTIEVTINNQIYKVETPVQVNSQTVFVETKETTSDSLVQKLGKLSICNSSYVNREEWVCRVKNVLAGMDSVIERISKAMSAQMSNRYCDILPRGFLITGPSGSGKSYLVSTLSRLSGLYTVFIHGPEVFLSVEDESEKILSKHFENARRNSPSILVIDEIESLARSGENDQSVIERRLFSCLLQEIDLSMKQPGVFIFGIACNLNEIDASIIGPKRLEDVITLKIPSSDAKICALNIMCKDFVFHDQKEVVNKIALETPGFTYADLQSLCTNAFFQSLKRCSDDNKDPIVTKDDFYKALEKTSSSIISDFKQSSKPASLNEIGGYRDVIEKLALSVKFPFERPDVLESFGVKCPTGVLIHGPPGTGKSFIIHAIAASTKTNFISISGPEILSKVAGESEARLEDIFKRAQLSSPCILYINQFDSIAQIRGNDSSEEHTADRILSLLLTKMDGILKNDSLIVIAETNRFDCIDKTILRPGRMDIIIEMRLPTIEDRIDIFTKLKAKMSALHLNNEDIIYLAESTNGWSGADIFNLCKEAIYSKLKEDINAKEVSLEYILNKLESKC